MNYKRTLLLFLLTALSAMAQTFTTVTASKIQDASGALLASGQLCAVGVVNGKPVSFRAGGGGIVTTTPVCATVYHGGVSLALADSNYTAPQNMTYVLTVTDTITGQIVLTAGPTQVTGGVWSLDTYIPSIVPPALIQVGPVGPAGPAATVTTNGTNGDFLIAGALRSKMGPVLDVTAWGATGNGLTYDSAAFVAAINAAGKGTVFLPAGTYLLDNSAGPIYINGFNGSVEGLGPGSSLVCTSTANHCLMFANSTGLRLENFSLSFQTVYTTCNAETTNCGGYRNGSQLLVVNTSTNVNTENLYLHDGPSSAFNMNSVIGAVIHGTRMQRMWANGLFFVNSSRIAISDTWSKGMQDAAIELSQYNGQPYVCQDITSNGFVSTDDFGMLLVNSCQNVSFTNFIVRDTYVSPINVYQDKNTVVDRWPDNIVISQGVISNAGSHQPDNPIVPGLAINASTTAAPSPMRLAISNVRIDGGNSGSISMLLYPDPQWQVSLDHIDISNASAACFDLAGGTVFAHNLSCSSSSGTGMVVRTANTFVGSNISLLNVANSANAPAFLNTSTGSVFINGMFVKSSLTPSRSSVSDTAASGIHVFKSLDLLTADGTTPGVSTNGSNSTVAYDGLANGSSLPGSVSTFNQLLAQSDYDSTAAGPTPQIVIRGKTNANNVFVIGFDTAANLGILQATTNGVSNRPISLNPNNGPVLVGTKTPVGSAALQVNGTILLNGIKATSGLATVCIDTSGNLVKGTCTGN